MKTTENASHFNHAIRAEQKAKAEADPRFAALERRCLGPCGQMFRSQWAGNRMCHNCSGISGQRQPRWATSGDAGPG